MSEFSLQECMSQLKIKDGVRLEKMRQLYCGLDKLIEEKRSYITACMFKKSFEKAENVERDTWRGILLRALKMGMESDLGGAIKQDFEPFDNMMTKIGMYQKSATGCICWASCPETNSPFLIPVALTKAEQEDARIAFENGQDLCFGVGSIIHDNIEDKRRHFEYECELMDLDRISLSPACCFRYGVMMNLDLAMNDGDMADTIENEYLSYKKMSSSERSKDFDSFLQEIRYVNGLAPRPIERHDDNMNNDNQNQR